MINNYIDLGKGPPPKKTKVWTYVQTLIISVKVRDFLTFSSESIFANWPHSEKIRVSTFLLDCTLKRNSMKIFV